MHSNSACDDPSGGDRNNRDYVGDTVRIDPIVSKAMQSALFDPQTAGGLLISVASDGAKEILSKVPGAVKIGSVTEERDHLIDVT